MPQPGDDSISVFPTVIESELRCRECGYILRGLRYCDACPECGTMIQGVRGSGAYARRLTYPDRVCRIFWVLLAGCAVFIVGTSTSVPVTSNSADPRRAAEGAILERVTAFLAVVALAGSAGLMFWPEFRTRKSAWLAVFTTIVLCLFAWICSRCN